MKRKLRSLSNRRVWNMKTKVQFDDLEWNEMIESYPKKTWRILRMDAVLCL